MPLFVVERYATGLTPVVLRDAGVRVGAAAHGSYLGSILIPDDEGSLCLFEADSAYDVERAARLDRTPFERIASVVLVMGDVAWNVPQA